MNCTRMSWLGWMARSLSLATFWVAAGASAQNPEFDPQAGSARISGGDPYADYRTDPGINGGHAIYPNYAPYPAYGGGWAPPPGVKLDPTFRAAAGLGGPSLAELDRLRFTILSSQGDIAGVEDGFTNIGAFIPRRVFSDYNLFAINPRVLIDNNGESGFNLGAIHRFYVPSIDRMFGQSYWYDYTRSYNDEIQTFGISLESVGRYLSLRANANITLGESQKIYYQQQQAAILSGHNIVLPILEGFYSPLDVYSFEAAVPAPYLGKYGLELGLGGYVMTGSGVEDTLGVSGRVQWQITEDLYVNTLITNDDLFDTNVSFNFELQFPDGRPSRIARPNPVVMSLTQSVQRNYQAKVARGFRTKYYSEIDPKDNLPIQVAIIDPNATASGNGSAGLPFQSLEQYMAVDAATRAGFDFIIVQPRADGTDINLNTGITITSTQHLIGNGLTTNAPRPTYTSTLGTFFLPGIVQGSRPRISNRLVPGTDVVTIAGNATEVANFTIVGTNTGSGIVSAGAIDGFNIHDNTILNVVDAVRITSNTAALLNCPGEDVGIIQRNVLRGVTGIGNLGASVTHTGGTIDLRITDNTLDPFANAGIEVVATGATSIVNAAGAGQSPEFGILRNSLDRMGTGIRVQATGGAQIFADVQDNVVTRSTSPVGAGLQVIAQDPGSTVVLNSFERNTFTGGRGDGASLAANGGANIIGAQAFISNQFTGNNGDGMHVEATGAGSAVILRGIGDTTIANANSFSGNGDDGFEASVTGGGQFVVVDPIVRQVFNSNGDNGFRAFASGAGSLLAFNVGDPASTIGNSFNSNGSATLTGAGLSIELLNNAAFQGGVFNVQATSNFGPGVQFFANNAAQGPLTFRNITAIGNGTAGLAITLLNSPTPTIDIINNVLNGSTTGDGLRITATGSEISNRLRISGNGLQNNAGHGMAINLDNSPVNNLIIANNLGGFTVAPGNVNFLYVTDGVVPITQAYVPHFMQNNSTAGIDIANVRVLLAPSGDFWRGDLPLLTPRPFQPLNNSDVLTGLTSVNGTAITAGTNPLQDANGLVLAFGGVPLGSQTLDLAFAGFNPGEQLNFDLAHSPVFSGGNVLFPNPGAQLIGATVEVTLTNGQVLTGTLVAAPGGQQQAQVNIAQAIAGTQQGISGNGLDGIFINAQNGSHINRMRVVNNRIDNSGQHGLEILAENSRLPAPASAIVVRNNEFTNNGGDGLRMINPHVLSTPIHLHVLNNLFDSNAGAGMNVAIDQDTELQFSARVNTVTNNGSLGLAMTATENSIVNLLVGSPTVNGNLYDNNTDAGVGMLLDGNAQGRATIVNSTFSNTVDAATPFSPFNGEGLAIVTQGNSTFYGSASNNAFTSNDGSGIFGSATGNNLTQFSQILFFDITNNNIQGNGRSGIEFLRNSNGRIGSQRAVNIQNNVIRLNPLDGISLSSRQAFTTDFYIIQDNLITQNSEGGLQDFNAGIHLDAQADAQLRADILRNQIINNVRDGILTTDAANFPTDQRSVGGNWFQNAITGNGGNGINLTGAINNLFIGSETDDTQGNLIANNTLDGVNNISAGTWSLANNTIQLNGVHGVDIGGVGAKDIRIIHNHITRNGTAAGEPGDGIEFNNNNQLITLTALGNIIDFNEGRGIDILNQTNAQSTIVIGTDTVSGQNTVINQNGGEGIYVVNTASASQTQNTVTPSQGFANGTDQPVGATHKGLQADGSIFATAFLNISIDEALVVANGQNNAATNFQATGIVFRVGTTGGGYGFTNPGGFASDIFFGGVVASLTNTTMGGNFGDDLLFESFTSTAAPVTTAGTWDQTQFSVTNFQGDPLARLDLTYRNNTFLENPTLDPLLITPALVTAQGAYYDNAEGTFKSRLNNLAAPNIAGPFASAARRRNAQRQALRVYGDGTVLPPVVPPGLQFLYPGMGDSTFRIDLANSDNLATLGLTGFLIDLTSGPLDNPFDTNGVFYPIGGNTQDFRSPWGWGTF